MTAQEVLTLRLALCANGYTPLPLYGKEPPIYGKNNKRQGLDKWQLLDNVTRGQLEMWDLSWPRCLQYRNPDTSDAKPRRRHPQPGRRRCHRGFSTRAF